MFEASVPLTPKGGGGICITADALNKADILLSTTDAATSHVIRAGTASVVSHAKLYIGHNDVIEAIGEGVVRRSLAAAMAHDTLTVAYRNPRMTQLHADRIVDFVTKQVGHPYSTKGAARAPTALCRFISTGEGFFCSQLVVEAYMRAGIPLTKMPSTCITPGGLVEIAEKDFQYVGHLKGELTHFPILGAADAQEPAYG